MNRWSIVPLAIAGFTLAGCGYLPVGHPTIDVEAAKARAAQIDLKTMTRGQVHALLGEPWIASDAFGVEVYRLQGKQRKMGMALLVPFPDFSDKLAAYTLVAYSADGVVGTVASDSASGPGERGEPPIILRAGQFEFISGSGDYLSVSLERYDEVRSAAPSVAACTVLVDNDRARLPVASGHQAFCMSHPRLSTDGTGQRVLPLTVPGVIPWERGMSRAVCENLGGNFSPVVLGDPKDQDHGYCTYTAPRARYPLTLPEGTHVLHFTLGHADVISTLTCQSDEIIYATLGGGFMQCAIDTGGGFAWTDGGAPTVTLSPQAPASDGEPRVVINENGTWLYPATSGAP